jgi:hypothetical protein
MSASRMMKALLLHDNGGRVPLGGAGAGGEPGAGGDNTSTRSFSDSQTMSFGGQGASSEVSSALSEMFM